MLLVRDDGAICGDCCFAVVWLEMLCLLVLDCCFEFFVLIVLVTCVACVRFVVWGGLLYVVFVALNCLRFVGYLLGLQSLVDCCWVWYAIVW